MDAFSAKRYGCRDSALTSSSSAASKSHKESERRRRHRINAHLSTLRSLLPKRVKPDKASLLAEAVDHLRQLRKHAAEKVAGKTGAEPWCLIPGELDEATVSCCGGGDGKKKMMRLSVCCNDRPGLNRDLSQAIRSVRARAVRAEMVTVGGRTKSVVTVEMEAEAGDNGGGWEEEDVRILKRALTAVVLNRNSGSGLGHVARGNKRARVS
ncbi:unnamed protein product [Linum tenue]|uniref:BHLH domain-containing protein n=1 Tax=Linum tenue TaxID=586396 RepID=A0AAV0K7X8_9ROSI|nr:unnamed protein product [Linum tenue]